MNYSPQGHVPGSDTTPMTEQTFYNGDNRTFKPNDGYSGVGRSDTRGPRGSAIMNDLARRR